MRYYKKILIISIILLFTACGNNNNTNANNTNYQKQSTKIEEVILGEYSTKLTDKEEGRLTNINLGISILNGTIVKPGATFSFNDTIGERNAKRGFKEAIIFDGKGNKEKGYGGGLCQISSTLYNTVKNAGLPIEERHAHSRDVPYVPDGKDATVSYYDNEDFRFTNNTDRDVIIKAGTTESRVITKIITTKLVDLEVED